MWTRAVLVVSLYLATRGYVSAGALLQTATSPHFEVLSEGSLEDARLAAEELERFRTLLEAATGLAGRPDATRVVTFRERGAFERLVPRHEGRPQEIDGFYQTGGASPTIVAFLDPERAEALLTLRHEYAHIFFNALLPAQPVWVSEGLAELYSTLDEEGASVRLGRAPLDHLRALREAPLLPVDGLLEVGYSSPAYVRAENRDVLYAQSWALVHALVVGQAGGSLDPLAAFLHDLVRGEEPAVLFTRHFGPEPRDLSSLLAYGLGARRGSVTWTAPPVPSPRVVARPATPAESATTRARLLLTASRTKDAHSLLREALESDPSHAPAHEALAHWALLEGRFAEARASSARALALQPGDAGAWLRHAQSIVREAQRQAALTADEEMEAVAALERAVAVPNPDPDACDLLARLRPQPLASRIALLEGALRRHPGRADLSLHLADLHLRRHDYTKAAHALVRAEADARDDTQAFLATHARRNLREMVRGKVEVHARLVELECGPGSQLTFVLASAAGRLRLRASSPTALFLYEPDGQPLEKTLVCGPQNAAVSGWFREGRPASDAQGTLLSLTFLAH